MLGKTHKQEVDYIIVGAGSAGCVLANRLSANADVSVAMFEAGSVDNSWKIHMPAALTYNLETTKYNWFYHTSPEPEMCNRKLYWPRGKVLGGSSSLNAMVYIRGHAKDFDRWHAEGATGWNYENVLPYFKRSETYSKGGDFYRGSDGPLKVIHKMTDNPLFDIFIEAGMQAGYRYTSDVNGADQEGFGRFDMTIDAGKRCSAAAAYLHPVRKTRTNLHSYTNCHVTKIIIRNQQAVGIEYVNHGRLQRCYAKREVILSGGAINSPQLLMLSGIGNSAELAKHNIDTIVDLPGVGQNLQDHLEFYMQYECKKPITLYSMMNPIKKASTGIQWFLAKKGLAASSHLEAGAFIKSDSSIDHPDIQYHFLPSLVKNHGRDLGDCHAFQVHVGTMRPESRGSVSLISSDPFEPVHIQANYLQTEKDLLDLMAAIPLTRELFERPAFRPYKGRELQPGLGCYSKAEMANFVRSMSDSAYHPCGTCKMGTDEMAVVDPAGRVYGVRNLRVVDASIMPSILSGNLNAGTIMLAEKIAEMIL